MNFNFSYNGILEFSNTFYLTLNDISWLKQKKTNLLQKCAVLKKNNPENSHLHTRHHENLKSQQRRYVVW
jgi:hypothetical protein